MRTAQPPIEPPTGRTIECNQCDGVGKTMHYTELLTVRVFEKCTRCNPYAPDNWKEAEGIA